MRQRILATILAILVVGSLGVGYLVGTGNSKVTTNTVTMTTTLYITLPITFTNVGCVSTMPGYQTPTPGAPWFTAGVNYSGPWEAVATVYNKGSPIFSQCYTGFTQGQFIYQNSNLTSTARIRITATKLDGSTGVLHVAVNGFVNSTAIPFGSATVSAPVNNVKSS
jgi:hypothetical protein